MQEREQTLPDVVLSARRRADPEPLHGICLLRLVHQTFHADVFPLRVRQLKDEPYSQKEAERVVGINVDNGKKATEEEMMDEDSMVEAT